MFKLLAIFVNAISNVIYIISYRHLQNSTRDKIMFVKEYKYLRSHTF